MTINKNDFIGHLKIPIVELMEVAVQLPKGMRMAIRIESEHWISEMLRKNPDERGAPKFAAIDNGRLVTVFPRTDKRYRLRVVGTQYVEQ